MAAADKAKMLAKTAHATWVLTDVIDSGQTMLSLNGLLLQVRTHSPSFPASFLASLVDQRCAKRFDFFPHRSFLCCFVQPSSSILLLS